MISTHSVFAAFPQRPEENTRTTTGRRGKTKKEEERKIKTVV